MFPQEAVAFRSTAVSADMSKPSSGNAKLLKNFATYRRNQDCSKIYLTKNCKIFREFFPQCCVLEPLTKPWLSKTR